MQTWHRILLLLFLLVAMPSVTFPVFAQEENKNTSALIDQANSLYYNGEFLDCIQLVKEHEYEFSGQQIITAYSLLSLSYLALDDMNASEQYALLLLREDPHYSVYNQNPRFRDMLSRLKKGETTISTASQQKETIEEAPVPVTLISRQMIELSGARTLQELLCLFVPGFSLVDGLETNIAMRGVFSQNQEAVLIMIDGHRLNSQSSNTEAPDYRTSLDKIQQVEVLRGPASSLYGNAALTAVVNIITRRGAEVDGNSVSLTGGSFKSVGASYIYGKGNLTQDLLAWGSIYNSQGQAVSHPATIAGLVTSADGTTSSHHTLVGMDTRYTGGFNRKPAFDLGIRCRWDDLSFMFTAQHSKRTPFFNQLSTGDNFQYDDYPAYRGSSPGTSRTQYLATVDYAHAWDHFSIKASAFGVVEQSQLYNVMGDSIDFMVGGLLGMLVKGQGHMIDQAVKSGDYEDLIKAIKTADVNTRGVWESIDWSSKTFGGSIQMGYNYNLANGQQGNMLAGVQYEYFKNTEGAFLMGGNYEEITMINPNGISNGDEQTTSMFFQLKHKFSSSFTFNGGFRLDNKSRINKESLFSFSPRVTFIWQPTATFSTKLGYAHSFVDAPYIYRASNILFYKGVNLKSEEMDAFQLSVLKNWPQLHLRYEGNLFMNHVMNLVYMDPSRFLDSELGESGTFVNSGSLDMLGCENVVEYLTPRTLLNANLTLQLPLSVKKYPSHESYVCNVPKFLMNMTAARLLAEDKSKGSFWLRGNIHIQSQLHLLKLNMLTAFANTSKAAMEGTVLTEDELYPSDRMSAKCVANIGADWKWRNLKVSLDCYNLFNTSYQAGGLLQAPVPQQGRSFMGKINVSF